MREGLGDPNSDEGTYTVVVLFIYTYFVLKTKETRRKYTWNSKNFGLNHEANIRGRGINRSRRLKLSVQKPVGWKEVEAGGVTPPKLFNLREKE